MEKKNNKKKIVSHGQPTEQVINVETKYVMIEVNEYERLKRENREIIGILRKENNRLEERMNKIEMNCALGVEIV